jgi:hypothetical protein
MHRDLEKVCQLNVDYALYPVHPIHNTPNDTLYTLHLERKYLHGTPEKVGKVPRVQVSDKKVGVRSCHVLHPIRVCLGGLHTVFRV